MLSKQARNVNDNAFKLKFKKLQDGNELDTIDKTFVCRLEVIYNNLIYKKIT